MKTKKALIITFLLASVQFLSAMDENTEFLLGYKGNRVPITRAALALSKQLDHFSPIKDFKGKVTVFVVASWSFSTS